MQLRFWIICLGCVFTHACSVLGQEKLADVASLIDQLSGDTFSQRQSAMRDLAGMGLAAIPSLTDALCDSDPETRWRASRTLEEIGLQGDERTLRKVTRIMYLLGSNGVSGLAEKSAQMRERWLESQVQRITNKLSELGAAVEVVPSYGNALDAPVVGIREIITIPEAKLPDHPVASDGTGADPAGGQLMQLEEMQHSIAEIIGDSDEVDDRALADLQTTPPKNPVDANLTGNDGELVWVDASEIAQVQVRNITIDANWKGTDADWSLLSRVSRLFRLNIASREMTAQQWEAIAEVSALRYLFLDKCEYDLADARAFREKRSDIIVRIVGRGFLGVMGPLDGSANECVISQVVPDSGAAKAGLMVDDEITAINGTRVNAFQDLIFIVGSLEPADEIKLEYRRAGEVRETTAVLQPRNQFDR